MTKTTVPEALYALSPETCRADVYAVTFEMGVEGQAAAAKAD